MTINELNSKIKESDQEIEVLRKSIDNFKIQEQLYNADLLNKESEIDRHIDLLKEFNEKLETLNAEVTSLKDHKASASAEFERLNGIIISKNDNIKRLEHQMSPKHNLEAADLSAYKQLRGEYKNLEKTLKHKEQELNKSLDSLAFECDENNAIRKQLGELRINNQCLREKITQQDSIEEEYRLKERTLANECEKIKKQNKKACDELAVCHIKLESIDLLQQENDIFKKRLAEIKQKYENILFCGNDNDELTTRVNILQAENYSLKKKINDKCIVYSQETERLEEQLSKLKM